MSSTQIERERMDVSAEHIGEIDGTDVTVQPGVTVLTGRNATNRTSLLQALMGMSRSKTMPRRGQSN
jgi:ABC-type branched-subunit amino acid transport system ATPase component